MTFHDDLKSNAGHGSSDPRTTIPTFLALYIFAFVYQLILVWDALRMKNTIQIIGLVGLNVGLLIYGAVQVDQLHDAIRVLLQNQQINAAIWNQTDPILIAIPCLLAFFTVVMAFVAYKLYNEFAWTIYKHISADLRMRRRYLTYQIYVALLKFDFFFTLGFTIQFVIIVGGRTLEEKYITVAAIPVTIIIMLAAFWFCRRESMVGTIAVIVLYFAGLAYFIFKLVRMYDPKYDGPYLAARKELTTFAVLTIGLLTATIVVACMCARNYGKGLMPYIRGTSGVASKPETHRMDMGPAAEHGQASPYVSQTYNMSDEPYGHAQKLGGGRPTAGRMEID